MKKIAILLLLLFSLESIAQNYQENLEKYWYYRHRLKEKFMYFSGDASYQGSHLPAENMADTIIRINNQKVYDQHYITWKDGGWWLGHYIGMLALEYRLLKDNGQDISETLLELNLALNTYDRLDRTAETCFNNNPENWNGFFLRDDLDEDNEIYFPRSDDPDKYLDLKSGYIETCNNPDDQGNVISQDQAIMMFFGLYMAKKLVDDEWVQQKVKWIADGIVGRMHEYKWPFKWWRIRNPVTEEIVPAGGKTSELLLFCWAIAEVTSAITGDDEHYSYSSWGIVKELFDLAQNNILVNFRNDEDPIVIPIIIFTGSFNVQITCGVFNAYMTAVLSLISNEWGGGEDNIYDWLVRLYNDTKGILGMPGHVGVYPHLPLIAEAIYGYNGTDRWPASLIENDFLNTAPFCGAHHYVYQMNGEEYHEVTDPPWHTLSLGSPQHNKGDGKYDGEYNMIDYMLLYTSYFKNYHNDEGFKPYLYASGDFPTIRTIIIYVHGHPVEIEVEVGNDEYPLIIPAARQIDAINKISSEGNITYNAGQNIRFLPGFKVDAGAYVKVSIDNSMNDQIYFTKTNVNTCTGGSFQSSFYTKTEIDSLLNLSRSERNSKWLSADNREHVSTQKIDGISFNEKGIGFSQNNDISSNTDDDQIKETTINVYPNPSNGIFNIDLDPYQNKTYSITITDSFGRCIFEQRNIKDQMITVNISNNKKGIYYLVINSNYKTKTFKLIVL